ncbi:hypothetical protein MHI01_29190 [Paenibacillus sp. FSL M7-0656]|uniref:hypothetical protein n=1 Tax=Paenibacillus sp. FSL M7-0656 TaxID=2921534 RepID=UPI0030F997FD
MNEIESKKINSVPLFLKKERCLLPVMPLAEDQNLRKGKLRFVLIKRGKHYELLEVYK